jgi:hypothetical protein
MSITKFKIGDKIISSHDYEKRVYHEWGTIVSISEHPSGMCYDVQWHWLSFSEPHEDGDLDPYDPTM